MKNTLWKSKKKCKGWSIEKIITRIPGNGNRTYLIVCDGYGWNTAPMLHKGRIYWDFPERIPQAVKDATLKVMTKRVKG